MHSLKETRSKALSFQSKVGLAVNKQRIKETIYMQIKVYHTNLVMLVSPLQICIRTHKGIHLDVTQVIRISVFHFSFYLERQARVHLMGSHSVLWLCERSLRVSLRRWQHVSVHEIKLCSEVTGPGYCRQMDVTFALEPPTARL